MKRLRPLEALAQCVGVQTGYRDVLGQKRTAQPEALLAVLQALGLAIARPDEAADVLRQTQLRHWLQPLQPAVVAWDGANTHLTIRLPSAQAPKSIDCVLKLEDGSSQRWQAAWDSLPLRERQLVEGIEFQLRELAVPASLPPGYHWLTAEIGARQQQATILSAPTLAYPMAEEKSWGVFIPLYAIRSRKNWDAGNYRNLAEVAEWTTKQGGNIVGTLPLLPGFYDQPFDPSPYAPVSRLLWNELYVDITALPELTTCAAAKKLLASGAVKKELQRLRGTKRVDYPRLYRLQRQVLALLARDFFKAPTSRHDDLEQLLKQHPHIEDYASFRAVMEQRGVWHTWPDSLKSGALQAGDYDEVTKRYYLYAQFAAQQQLHDAASRAKAAGAALYLDLPLGVHPDGYDAWRHQRLFAPRMSTGAPPDSSFPWGQNWGFAPLLPEQIRADGYRYVSAYIRHHMRHAGVLRIDHVMGLHRLFWIPVGLPSSHGVYVTYPADELYAVLTLESRRNRCAIVGENLGTVPPYVGPAMTRHGLARMYVLQYELDALKGSKLGTPRRQSLASVNTHDMPHFAGYWRGDDIRQRFELKLMGRSHAAAERKRRKKLQQILIRSLFADGSSQRRSERVVYRAILKWLGGSAARILLVNLEDLWGETDPQNIPGTSSERPNWRGKAQKFLEDFSTDREIIAMLTEGITQRSLRSQRPD